MLSVQWYVPIITQSPQIAPDTAPQSPHLTNVYDVLNPHLTGSLNVTLIFTAVS